MFGNKDSSSPASSPTAASPAPGQGPDSLPASVAIPNSNQDPQAESHLSASPASTTFSTSPAPSTISNTDGPALTNNTTRSNSNASTASRPGITSTPSEDKKRRSSSSVGTKAQAFLASAKNSLHFSPSPHSVGFGKSSSPPEAMQTPLQKLGRQDPALSVPQGQHNNSAGESLPGPRSTFRVGVWEDKNKKCRRTMEDTHAFLYNFLHTPAPKLDTGKDSPPQKASGDAPKTLAEAAAEDNTSVVSQTSSNGDMMETDNGYFAIFDGHAGTFAADWCGKKLHIILEEMIRANPNTPIPELLDLTFTNVDRQLEKLPLKNSGCTAVCAVLRWEDRIPNPQSATGSTAIAPATAAAVKAQDEEVRREEKKNKRSKDDTPSNASQITLAETQSRLKQQATRQRVLYTANVGDARVVLCRNGKALRLSYDHKGSDENEGKRVANAGGLILNNRVNGVLAVTRALGDAYMKDLVTGHPYTTETVVQCGEKGEGGDEFIILACDGLWDVCSDQEAVDLVRNIQDPVTASKALVDHALARFSTDNLSCMIVRLNKVALADTVSNETNAIGVEGDPVGGPGTVSEADKIVAEARRKVESEGAQAGVSGSNSGKGHEPSLETKVSKIVEEDPHLTEADSREVSGVPGKKKEKEKEISPTRSTRSLNIFRKSSPTGSPPKQ